LDFLSIIFCSSFACVKFTKITNMKNKHILVLALLLSSFGAFSQPFSAYRLNVSTIFRNNVFRDGHDSVAQLQSPRRMIALGDTAILLADQDNNRIRSMNILNRTIRTVAGDGRAARMDSIGVFASLNRPKDLCLIGDTVVYFTEEGSHTIRKLVLATGSVTTIAGSGSGFVNGQGTAARFNNPNGITNRGDSVLYVSDGSNNRIRRITLKPSIEVTTFAGTGSQTYIARDSLHKDSINIGTPRSVLVVGNNLVMIENDFQHPVIRFMRFGENVFYDLGGQDRPEDIAWVGGDTIITTCSGGGPSILVKVLSNPAFNQNIVGIQAEGIVKIGGMVYYSLPSSAIINSIAYTGGSASRFFGRGRSADGDPSEARIGTIGSFTQKGNWIYFFDEFLFRVRRFNKQSGMMQTLTRGNRGNNSNGAKVSFAATNFNTNAGIVKGSDGRIYIADRGNNQIRAIDETRDSVFLVAGNTSGGYVNGTLLQARFNNIGSMVEHNGKWYVAEPGTIGRIRVIDPAANTVTTLAGPEPGFTGTANGYTDSTGVDARFGFDFGSFLVRNDTLLFADRSNRRLRGVDIAQRKVFTFGGTNAYDNFPFVFRDRTGTLLGRIHGARNEISNLTNPNSPVVVVGAQGSGNVDGVGTVARFNNPGRPVVDSLTGEWYIPDVNNQTFRKVEYILFNQAPTITGPTPSTYNVTTINPITESNYLQFSPGPAWETSQTLSVFGVTVTNPAIFAAQPSFSNDGTMNLTASGTNGTSQVRICVRDNGGTAFGGNDSACYTFNVVANITGLNKTQPNYSVQVFPNPSENGQVFWKSTSKIQQVEILDVLGRQSQVSITNGSTQGELQLPGSGLYLIKLINVNGQTEIKKVQMK